MCTGSLETEMKKVYHVLARPILGDNLYFSLLREKVEAFGNLVVQSSKGVSEETRNFLSSCGYICWGGEGVHIIRKNSGSIFRKNSDAHLLLTCENEEGWENLLKEIAAHATVVDVKRENGHWTIFTETEV